MTAPPKRTSFQRQAMLRKNKMRPHFRCLNWFNAPALHPFTLHYTTLTLHYITHHGFSLFAPITYVHCHEHKRSATMIISTALELVDVTFKYGCHLNQSWPCRPLLQSVTRVAQTLIRYESDDRRTRKISLFILTHLLIHQDHWGVLLYTHYN
jgi:hypothetical protein